MNLTWYRLLLGDLPELVACQPVHTLVFFPNAFYHRLQGTLLVQLSDSGQAVGGGRVGQGNLDQGLLVMHFFHGGHAQLSLFALHREGTEQLLVFQYGYLFQALLQWW